MPGMTFDRIKAVQVFRDRPRGGRGMGRTVAALYRALTRASQGQRLVYVSSTYSMTRRAASDALTIVNEVPDLGSWEVEVAYLRHSAGGLVYFFSSRNLAEIDEMVRQFGGIADDLGEWAEQNPQPTITDEVSLFSIGLAQA